MSVVTMLPAAVSRSTRFGARSREHVPPWLRRHADASIPVPDLGRDLRVKLASTRAEWEGAFRLVADNYRARGYESQDGADYRFTSYHALPDTVVLVAKEGERVVATFTLVPDNVLLGLPMESLYRHEIQQLRQAGRRLFETGCLADDDLSLREFVHVFKALMRLGWQTMVRQGANTTVIAVNPRHSGFYQRQHGFAPLGPRRAYVAVRGNPAEAFCLDPERMRRQVPEMYRQFFGQALPADVLTVPPLPVHLIRHFAGRSSCTDPRLVDEVLRYVNEHGSPRRW